MTTNRAPKCNYYTTFVDGSATAITFVFRIGPKITKLLKDIEYLLPLKVKFSSVVQQETLKISLPIRC